MRPPVEVERDGELVGIEGADGFEGVYDQVNGVFEEETLRGDDEGDAEDKEEALRDGRTGRPTEEEEEAMEELLRSSVRSLEKSRMEILSDLARATNCLEFEEMQDLLNTPLFNIALSSLPIGLSSFSLISKEPGLLERFTTNMSVHEVIFFSLERDNTEVSDVFVGASFLRVSLKKVISRVKYWKCSVSSFAESDGSFSDSSNSEEICLIYSISSSCFVSEDDSAGDDDQEGEAGVGVGESGRRG